MEMKTSHLPKFLRPKLRLFMSMDLVGSTALKQPQDGSVLSETPPSATDDLKDLGAAWILDVAGFYAEVESLFIENWKKNTGRAQDDWSLDCQTQPVLWKRNGDELIYFKELKSSRDCFVCILSWKDTARTISEQIHKKNSKLDVKASAWTAGFPLVNTEFVFNLNSAGIDNDDIDDPAYQHYNNLNLWHSKKSPKGLVIDFIGPSIDTGFRISSKASPRKFMISIEVALILSLIQTPKNWSKPMLRFDRCEKLKGVINNEEYPLFWIDMYDADSPRRSNLTTCEDKIRGDGQNFPAIKEYCEEFLEKNRRYIIRPFILGDSESLLSSPPKNYEARIDKIFQKWENLRKDSEERKKSYSWEDSEVPPAPLVENLDVPIVNEAREGE